MEALTNPQDDITDYVYDNANRLTTEVRDNGSYTKYKYDDAGQTKSLAHYLSNHSLNSIYTYTYDKAGMRKGVVEDTGDRVTWTYDNTYQLVSEQRSGAHNYLNTYTYDLVGNRLTKTDSSGITSYVYDDANRIKTSENTNGVTTYIYDANGNKHIVIAPDLERTTYSWDFENQNTEIEFYDSGSSSYEVIENVYDGELKRIAQTQDSTEKKFIWDNQNILLVTDDMDVTQYAFTLTPDEYGSLISQYDTSGMETFWHLYDVQGSTVALNDSSEVETDTYIYQAFGKLSAHSGTTENNFTWKGKIGYWYEKDLEGEGGYYSIRRRGYDANNGRFISQDPVRDDEENLYRYSRNDAINKSDPSGLDLRDNPQYRALQDRWNTIRKAEDSSTFKLNDFNSTLESMPPKNNSKPNHTKSKQVTPTKTGEANEILDDLLEGNDTLSVDSRKINHEELVQRNIWYGKIEAKAFTEVQEVGEDAITGLSMIPGGGIAKVFVYWAYGEQQSKGEATADVALDLVGLGVLKSLKVWKFLKAFKPREALNAMKTKGIKILNSLKEKGLKGWNSLKALIPSQKRVDKLFAYTPKAEFIGDVLETKAAGRAWASKHAPGDWAYKWGFKNTFLRLWRTGRLKPFGNAKEITGPARDLFSPASGIGPARLLLKRASGQFFTKKPGNVNLKTLDIEVVSTEQLVRYYAEIGLYYGLDIATYTAIPATYIYVNMINSETEKAHAEGQRLEMESERVIHGSN